MVIRVAVVGVGRMGLRHVRGLISREQVELVGVVDRAGSPVVPEVRRHDNVLDLLSSTALDLVVVSVPPSAHAPIAASVLDAGVACLVDKPLATTRADADALVALAGQRDVVLAVAHTERFNPAWISLRKAIVAADESLLGVRAERHGPRPPGRAVGPALDLGVHDVDLAMDLLGETSFDVRAGDHGRVVRMEANVSGVQVSVVSAWSDSVTRSFSVFAEHTAWTANLLTRTLTTVSGGVSTTQASSGCEPLVALHDDVLAAVMTNGVPAVNGGHGARAVRAVTLGA
jgi:UDP-N-acetylglucosamine 3-dehydrogenase